MEIVKVRLHKTKKGNGLVLTYKKKENGDDVDCLETHKAPIHQETQEAIDALAIHLACMTFYVKGSQIEDIAMPDPALSEKFHINGYSIGGDDDNPGVVLSGHHIGPNGLAVILNTPFRKFDENPATRYEFMDDLQARIRVIESEIEKYLNGTKRGQAIQPELPLGQAEPGTEAAPDAMERVAEMGQSKGKRKGKKQPAEEKVNP